MAKIIPLNIDQWYLSDGFLGRACTYAVDSVYYEHNKTAVYADTLYMKLSDLEKLGLQKKEARAYLACLEMGSGTALAISKSIGIPKSTTHDLLNGLVAKGLASTYLKKSKKYYSASDPDMIGQKAKSELQVFERILPELQALAFRGVGKPKVRYFDTEVGIEIAVKEMFAEAKDLLFYGSVDAAFTSYPDYFPHYIKYRVQKQIVSRGIIADGPIAKQFQANDGKSLRRTKIVPSMHDVTSFVWMWNDKFVIFNTTGNHSVLILEDKRFATLFRSMFEMLWESVK